MTAINKPANPPRKRSKARDAQTPAAGGAENPIPSRESGLPPRSDAEQPPIVGEFIGKQDEPGNASSQAMVAVEVEIEKADEEVVKRVEHLNRGAGWTLITAGIVGLVVPGVIGTPFLIMGALALWPGNRKTVEHWRKGHSPKIFHGAMKQINRFLDDLEKRYPRIDRQ